jgi:hypothetical protein
MTPLIHQKIQILKISVIENIFKKKSNSVTKDLIILQEGRWKISFIPLSENKLNKIQGQRNETFNSLDVFSSTSIDQPLYIQCFILSRSVGKKYVKQV